MGWKRWLLETDLKVYAVLSCRVHFEGNFEGYTLVDNTDMLLDISDFPSDAKGRLRVVWRSSIYETHNKIRLYDQYAAVHVSGSEVVGEAEDSSWHIRESSLFTLPTGLKSFMIEANSRVDTLTYVMYVDKVELQIVRG